MIRGLFAAVSIVVVAVFAAPTASAEAPYKNCSAARADGATNIPSTSDKYGSHLDRDGDGIGCES